MAGMLPRDHVDHIRCSDNFAWCVPAAVHRELVKSLAPAHDGDRDKAGARLLEWYPTVWAQLKPADVIGDAFKFWRGWFSTSFGTASSPASERQQPIVTKSTVPNAADTMAYLRRRDQ